MRTGTTNFFGTIVWLSFAAFFAASAEVRAQQQNLFCPQGFSVHNGSCTSNPGVVDPGGLSQAALASQALSELSQTTTQQTMQEAKKGIEDRLDQERNRCAVGFARVDGACQPITPPVRAEALVEPQPAPPPSPRLKKTKKPKVAAIRREEEHVPAVEVVRRERTEARPRHATLAPPPAMVCKDQPCAPIPAPIPTEPAVRFATWTQLYGDHERRSAAGTALVQVTPPPGFATQQAGLDLDVHSQTGTIGFLAGADFTSRGVLYGNDGLIAGAMAGYVSSNLNLQTTATPNTPVSGCAGNCIGVSHTFAKLTGPSAGLYATYFNGGFSTDVSLKVDALSLNENFDNWVTLFAPGAINPTLDRQALVVNGGSTHLLNATVAVNANYRFDLQNNFWIEPTAGVQYTNSSYASDAANLGLADGYLLMVQGGARVGSSSLLWNNVLMTTILTGLAYDDVLVKGGFIAGAGFLANNVLVQADEGQVRGRGILALNFDFGQGISSFVQGEAYGGKGLFGAGGRAGVRYVW
ncbi:MAG: autotransporter outer membrane beta-barrel domain-containing protein [Pseudomonadota bacterium]|nr:autotransporter outer membrane beta-barrel domain-containing protein [Pseudomonadota bacterium]